jgi:hypothetical protein
MPLILDLDNDSRVHGPRNLALTCWALNLAKHTQLPGTIHVIAKFLRESAEVRRATGDSAQLVHLEQLLIMEVAEMRKLRLKTSYSKAKMIGIPSILGKIRILASIGSRQQTGHQTNASASSPCVQSWSLSSMSKTPALPTMVAHFFRPRYRHTNKLELCYGG